MDGVEVLIPVALAEGSMVVRVFVTRDELRRGVSGAWSALGALGLLLITGALVVARRLGRSMVMPVLDLADAAHRLGSGDLTARVAPQGPIEIETVGRSFNAMADRVDDLLRAEREVAADLSHRLRSPLTALRLQAEGLDAADSSAMTIQIDRLSREVDRIIAEARTPGVNTDRRADLVVVARERAAFWSALAEEQGRLMSISLPPGPVFGAITAEDLAVAIDVLIDNVFSHTPSGTALHVEVMAGPPRLIVQDAGPGFDDAAIERGASGARSTGLGLDIARRTAAGAGGSIAVERAPGGGSRVVLTTASP